MRHGLICVALKDLLKLIDAIFEAEVISSSIHVFESIFRGSFEMPFHFYCPSCKAYLGKTSDIVKDDDDIATFPNELRETKCNIGKKNEDNFFIYIPVEPQLRSLLESASDVWGLLNYRVTREVDDCISDIYDGSIYEEQAAEGQILSDVKKNVSISSGTDGSPVFKATHNSMRALQFRLNELSSSERFCKWNTMVAGIWFGREEPEMSTFLAPFAKESVKLYDDGFKWTDPEGDVICSRVATTVLLIPSHGRRYKAQSSSMDITVVVAATIPEC